MGASAQPTSKVSEYSPYEKEAIAGALKATKLQIDPTPDGKIIERIDTYRLEVLEPRDPIPEEIFLGMPNTKQRVGIEARKLANSLHAVSRDFVIRRAMLLKEGDPYDRVVADETARNMRGS